MYNEISEIVYDLVLEVMAKMFINYSLKCICVVHVLSIIEGNFGLRIHYKKHLVKYTLAKLIYSVLNLP